MNIFFQLQYCNNSGPSTAVNKTGLEIQLIALPYCMNLDLSCWCSHSSHGSAVVADVFQSRFKPHGEMGYAFFCLRPILSSGCVESKLEKSKVSRENGTLEITCQLWGKHHFSQALLSEIWSEPFLDLFKAATSLVSQPESLTTIAAHIAGLYSKAASIDYHFPLLCPYGVSSILSFNIKIL